MKSAMYKDFPFIEWLKHFEGIDRPIGDLAKDILPDPNFPKTNKPKDIRDYLTYEKKADHKVIEVFNDVWKAYRMLI
jgi:uncharacterized protein YozE (UPF0346 family)